MQRGLSRREFLRLALWGIAATGFRGYLPLDEELTPYGIGRVAADAVRIYQKPSYKSKATGWRRKDEILNIYAEMASPSGPKYNPRWYRIVGGYAHSGGIQRVDDWHKSTVSRQVSEGGQLAEVTVPFTDSQLRRGRRWRPLYRLYYQSVHWVTGIDAGPDGEPWYRLTDELLHLQLFVPANHLRMIDPAELTAISSDVPDEEKRIDVFLKEQALTAYEGDTAVLSTRISSGAPSRELPENGIPTETPAGKFYISLKMPSKHMGDGEVTADPNAYELLGVPWTSFFVHTGVAFHGTWWHDNFGTRMSHGCVNMRSHEALWLFRWTTPVVETGEWYRRGRGTLVRVFD